MGQREDWRSFRSALGCYATGVTVITTVAADGRRVGLTANSFSSVSLDPPLVLWSLKTASPNLSVFKQAAGFAINVLAADQTTLSQRFADPRIVNKFEGLSVELGLMGVPLLPDCLASFECTTEAFHTVGDHELFIGRVQQFMNRGNDRTPLVFCGGEYAEVRPVAAAAS